MSHAYWSADDPKIRALLAPQPYHCESCGASTLDPAGHEAHYHDGAQTCWPARKEAV